MGGGGEASTPVAVAEQLVIVIYLGWVGLFLLGYALFATRRHREFGPWVWLGIFFFIFSLGPYLNMFGGMVELDGRRIPLPFAVRQRP